MPHDRHPFLGNALRPIVLIVTCVLIFTAVFHASSQPALAADVSIGVLGCSNTWQHTEAYHETSIRDAFWSVASVKSYSGGTLAQWAIPTASYWTTFTANLVQYPATSIVWIQLCLRAPDASPTGMTAGQQAQLTYVINRVKQLVPGATVMISPLNHYAAPTCGATGPYGQPNSVQLADWAASQGMAVRGPNTGPLAAAQLNKDLCHLNKFGSALVGPQMVDFFDHLPPLLVYWCVDGDVVTTGGPTPPGTYVAGPYDNHVDAQADPGCAPPPLAYWCVDGAVVTVTDGTTPSGSYVAGPYDTHQAATNDPGCVPPVVVYWCVDGGVVTTTGPTPPGTYVAGPYATQVEAQADPGCFRPAPTYWCVDGAIVTVNDGSTPTGGYIAGPYSTPLTAIDDPGCRTPRISTSTNPVYAGQPVTFTDFFAGTHKRRWSMGNGASFATNSGSLTYTYSTPGTYLVTLETKDAAGARAILTRAITVIAP